MKRILLALTLLLAAMLLQPRATQAQTTPLQFNDHIAYITDSLFAKGQQWGRNFNAAYTNKDFASLRQGREELERFIDARIKELTAMKDVKNSKELRMAMINFLTYEKTMVSNGFKPMELLPADASEEQVKAALDKMSELSKKEAGELEKVGAAQEAYAKANGFAIAAPKEEGKE